MAKKKVVAKKKTAKKIAVQDGVKNGVTKKVTAKNTSTQDSLLKAGQKAPQFSLINDAGVTVKLSALRGNKVVLYFYPKDNTPGCTQESCDFRDSFSRLKKQGVVVLGVSRDSVQSHQKFKNKYDLPFELLADESGKVCESYGVWQEKSNYGKTYMGIVRSTFLIDEQGKLLKVYSKVSVKGHVDEVIAELGASK